LSGLLAGKRALVTGGEVGADVRVADLAEAEACAGVVADAIAQLGGLDILVNNAAILHFAHSPEVTPEKWDKTIAVNLSAPFTSAAPRSRI
jgi:NAD(P)-dependent dehydrogenase (short-subunit alcohol dehydrogenase family)